MSLRLALISALLLLAGCDLTDPDDPGNGEPVTTGILVAAQGAFLADDGAVTLFRIDGTRAAVHDGGYFQSVSAHGGYVFTTSADRVDRLSLPWLKPAGTLSGVPNPRYLAFGESHGFVTNLYTDFDTFSEGAVTRFNLSTLEAEAPVVIGGNPEGIARIGDRLFVANHDWGSGTSLTVLDTQSMQVVATVGLECDGPQAVIADASLQVQVVCEGSPPWSENPSPGAIVTVDPVSHFVVARTDFDVPLRSSVGGQVASYVPETRTIFAISGDLRLVHQFDTVTNSLVATLDVGGAPIGAVAYDPRREYLYLARQHPTSPFTAHGTLTVHTKQGTLVDTFAQAGVAPTHIEILSAEE